jgi:hypothetical protein
MFIDLTALSNHLPKQVGSRGQQGTGTPLAALPALEAAFHGTFELPATTWARVADPANLRQSAMRRRIVDALRSCG